MKMSRLVLVVLNMIRKQFTETVLNTKLTLILAILMYLTTKILPIMKLIYVIAIIILLQTIVLVQIHQNHHLIMLASLVTDTMIICVCHFN